MTKEKTNRRKHLRILVFSSILCALAVILEQYASIKIGTSIRIGFGSVPIIMAGCLFGPYVGMAVGLVSDILGCAFFYGFGSLIPLITLGAVAEGLIAGLLGKKLTALPLTVATFAGHITSKLVFRLLGLRLHYQTPWETLVVRIPIALIEAVLITVLLILLFCTNTAVKKAVRGLFKNDVR